MKPVKFLVGHLWMMLSFIILILPSHPAFDLFIRIVTATCCVLVGHLMARSAMREPERPFPILPETPASFSHSETDNHHHVT